MGVTLRDRVRMWFLKVPSSQVAQAVAAIEQSGGQISTDVLVSHYLASGNIQAVSTAISMLLQAGQQPDQNLIFAADLAGVDVVSAVDDALRQRAPVNELLCARIRSVFGEN